MNVSVEHRSVLAVLNLFSETNHLSFQEVDGKVFYEDGTRITASDLVGRLNDMISLGLIVPVRGMYVITKKGLLARNMLEDLKRTARVSVKQPSARRYLYNSLREEYQRKPGGKDLWRDLLQARD